jgi:GntR family transcriptional regulator
MTIRFEILTNSSSPIYKQIVEQVARALQSDGLRPGDSLPSVRALAEQLVINPNTVAKAYAELVREGLVDSQQGKGFFAAERRQVYHKAERARRLDAALDRLLAEASVLGFDADELKEIIANRLDGRGRERRGKT